MTTTAITQADHALLTAFGCVQLTPLIEDGTLRVVSPDADPSKEWETLELTIDPLRRRHRGEIVTCEITVMRDADIATEQAQDYAPGEGPNQKFTVEYESRYRGPQFVEAFDDADELIAWVRSEVGD